MQQLHLEIKKVDLFMLDVINNIIAYRINLGQSTTQDWNTYATNFAIVEYLYHKKVIASINKLKSKSLDKSKEHFTKIDFTKYECMAMLDAIQYYRNQCDVSEHYYINQLETRMSQYVHSKLKV